MLFPYEKYEIETEPFSVYYSESQDSLVHLIIQSVDQASQRLMQLLGRPGPNLQVILVAPADWHVTPHDDPEEPGFDWYEDTSAEEYLIFNLLLERFAADLQVKYSPEILPRFLDLYRNDCSVLLSDDVTDMLASILGPGGADWLENLVYF